MSSWQPAASFARLKQRAECLATIRQFFAERNVLEVETSILSQAASTEVHLHSLSTRVRAMPSSTCYLNTSPEYQMKRLLAAGCGDIYQVAKVFRDDERGRKHHAEFTLLEWYRVGWTASDLQREVIELIQQLAYALGDSEPLQSETKTYRSLFMEYLEFDPIEQAVPKTLSHLVPGLPDVFARWSPDIQLDWLMSEVILPAQDPNVCLWITDFPASQASLAALDPNDPNVAQRFECIWRGSELANGFVELTDPEVQHKRFEQDLKARRDHQLPIVPMDQMLLQALKEGLPACVGVALGIERLLMCLLDLEHIDEIIAFPLERA